MAIKIKTKEAKAPVSTSSHYINPLKIPVITAPKPYTPNIIIRAVKIMLMDIRMLIHPKTQKDLEVYSEFSNLAYGRK